MERLPDLLRVPLAAVIHHPRSANYFQVRDSCEAAQNFSVDAIGKKAASALSPSRLSKGSTAIPADACSGALPHVPIAANSAIDNGISAALVGLRCTHFLPRMAIPMRRARIGSCFSQRSKSSPSTRADEYRRCGSFSRHLRQIVEKSRSICDSRAVVAAVRFPAVVEWFRKLCHRQTAHDLLPTDRAIRFD
jgi:hypothetical protein